MDNSTGIDFTAHIQAQWERNCQLAAAVIVMYEYIFQWRSEVHHFWNRKWSFAKVLFLWSRYYSLAFTISNATVFMHKDASMDFCMNFFHWQNTGATLQYLTTQVILQLRLYAMYGNSKKILAFLIFLTSAEIAALACFFGIQKEGLVGTNNPSPGLIICADADPPNDHWMAWVPMAVLITETTFLSMALYKAWEHYRLGMGGKILPFLVKESVFYFVAIFGMHLANLIIWMINIITVNELFTGFSFAIPAVLANRLLISVREQAFKTNTTFLSQQSVLSWRVPGAVSTNQQSDTMYDRSVGDTFERSTDVEADNFEMRPPVLSSGHV